ncbi:MAG TPA: hypothetical protein VL917_08525 [Sphingomicrobium sp.]|jgi:hypothetical protein|nr:hypothetical protein [Sphingomicrobium sp.]
MGEPKAFASLSSGLLARKGAARPAMRPQGFGQVGGNVDDLGWNDMGFEAPKPALAPVRDENHDAFGEELPDHPLRNPIAALTPIASPVHDQQAEIEERFAAQDEDGEEGEDENGEYVDETAEPCDPEDADAAAEAIAESQAAAVLTIPVRAVEPEPALAPAPVRPRRPRAAPGSKGKAAFTLRLDPSRHLKLRLACAVDGRSAQQIVTDALDQLLEAMPELDSMAERAPAKKRAEG